MRLESGIVHYALKCFHSWSWCSSASFSVVQLQQLYHRCPRACVRVLQGKVEPTCMSSKEWAWMLYNVSDWFNMLIHSLLFCFMHTFCHSGVKERWWARSVLWMGCPNNFWAEESLSLCDGVLYSVYLGDDVRQLNPYCLARFLKILTVNCGPQSD